MGQHAGRRKSLLELKKSEAKERQKEYNSLTTVEKIKRLNEQVGSNIGATKQRKRLQKQLKK